MSIIINDQPKNGQFIEACFPTPVLNTPYFSRVFGGKIPNQIPLNTKGLPFHYEFVALKGAVFQIEEIFIDQLAPIYKVRSFSYRGKELFVDSRTTKVVFKKQIKDCVSSPILNRQLILNKMKAMEGKAYVWGGNWSAGIPQWLNFYPPQEKLDNTMQTLWTFNGVDCSGMLYEATEGASPRNTQQLIYYGNPVMNLADLQPLDMIVYPGHVLFVLNSSKIIESKFPFGVIERSLDARLTEILSSKKWAKQWNGTLDPKMHFTVRRFC
jgi:hypothetical protein